MTYASVQDVSARLGRPIAEQVEVLQVATWLGDVEAAIAARFTRAGLVLADAVTAGAPSAATVVRVEAEAVIRRMANPLVGRKSTTLSVDDATVTDRWDTSESSSRWLTDADWADLLPVASGGAFSTRPTFLADEAAPVVSL